MMLSGRLTRVSNLSIFFSWTLWLLELKAVLWERRMAKDRRKFRAETSWGSYSGRNGGNFPGVSSCHPGLLSAWSGSPSDRGNGGKPGLFVLNV